MIEGSNFIKKIFRDNSNEATLVRLMDIEQGVTPGSKVKMPASMFVKENELNDIDSNVKSKIIKHINKYFYDNISY